MTIRVSKGILWKSILKSLKIHQVGYLVAQYDRDNLSRSIYDIVEEALKIPEPEPRPYVQALHTILRKK